MKLHSLLLCTLFCIATGCDSLAARPKDRDDRGCATYNILDFRAKNDGTTDCAPAFEKIFRRMEGKRQVEIVLPAGSFRISRRIVSTSRSSADTITIREFASGERGRTRPN